MSDTKYGGYTAAELRALLEKATPQNLDTAEGTEDGHYECPLCGDGEVEGRTYTNYDGIPIGVQFFGIGEEHGQAEALFRAAMRALPALLSAVEGKGRETCGAVAPPILTSDAIDGIVHLVVRDVAELPDRTSPPDQEHMMLVAGDELEDIVRHALQAFLAYAPALASPSTEGVDPGPPGEYETIEEANAAGVFSGTLANGDTFGGEDDGPEGGHTVFTMRDDAWEPIETVPKDAPILIACNLYVEAARFDGQVFWYAESEPDSNLVHWFQKPTHWMPFPAPPAPEQEGHADGLPEPKASTS